MMNASNQPMNRASTAVPARRAVIPQPDETITMTDRPQTTNGVVQHLWDLQTAPYASSARVSPIPWADYVTSYNSYAPFPLPSYARPPPPSLHFAPRSSYSSNPRPPPHQRHLNQHQRRRQQHHHHHHRHQEKHICFALLKATTGATKPATTEARRRAIARTPQSRHRVTLAYTIHITPPHTTLRNAPFSVLRVGAIMRGPWTGICIVDAAIRGGDRPSTKTRGGNAFCARVADRLAASRSWIVDHFASRPSSRARCSDPTSCA